MKEKENLGGRAIGNSKGGDKTTVYQEGARQLKIGTYFWGWYYNKAGGRA